MRTQDPAFEGFLRRWKRHCSCHIVSFFVIHLAHALCLARWYPRHSTKVFDDRHLARSSLGEHKGLPCDFVCCCPIQRPMGKVEFFWATRTKRRTNSQIDGASYLGNGFEVWNLCLQQGYVIYSEDQLPNWRFRTGTSTSGSGRDCDQGMLDGFQSPAWRDIQRKGRSREISLVLTVVSQQSEIAWDFPLSVVEVLFWLSGVFSMSSSRFDDSMTGNLQKIVLYLQSKRSKWCSPGFCTENTRA